MNATTTMAAPASTVPPPALGRPLDDRAESEPVVRRAVRDLLLSSAAFCALEPDRRREAARALVRVCQTAVSLMREEAEGSRLAESARAPSGAALPRLAVGLSAGQQFSGVSAEKVAGTTRAILNAVSFPRFVTELINGVFKALVDSSQQQMNSYVELIKNVAASTEGFTDLNMAPARARQWLVEQFPGSYEMDTGSPEDEGMRDQNEEAQEAQVRVKEGGTPPSEEALKAALGLAPGETIPSGDPDQALVPFARRALARQRQQMLGTMVMLGMQRIIVESGRINASMRFHIDTKSAAAEDAGSTFDLRNTTEAKGNFGWGPWGMEAKMTNTIGYVSTQRTQTTEEMNTDLDLNSSVELYFKTDYLPLDRLAGKGQVDRIKVNTLNPEAEMKAAQEARTARYAESSKREAERRQALDKALIPDRSLPPSPNSANSAATPKTKATDKDAAKKGDQTTATKEPAKKDDKSPGAKGAAKSGKNATAKGGAAKNEKSATPATAK